MDFLDRLISKIEASKTGEDRLRELFANGRSIKQLGTVKRKRHGKPGSRRRQGHY